MNVYDKLSERVRLRWWDHLVRKKHDRSYGRAYFWQVRSSTKCQKPCHGRHAIPAMPGGGSFYGTFGSVAEALHVSDGIRPAGCVCPVRDISESLSHFKFERNPSCAVHGLKLAV